MSDTIKFEEMIKLLKDVTEKREEKNKVEDEVMNKIKEILKKAGKGDEKFLVLSLYNDGSGFSFLKSEKITKTDVLGLIETLKYDILEM